MKDICQARFSADGLGAALTQPGLFSVITEKTREKWRGYLEKNMLVINGCFLRLMIFIYNFLVETWKTIMYLYTGYLSFKSPISVIYVGIILLLLLIWLFKYVESHPNGIYALDAKKTRTGEVFSLPTDIYGVMGSCPMDSSYQVIKGNDIPSSEERKYSHT